jgi:uncharacterized protein
MNIDPRSIHRSAHPFIYFKARHVLLWGVFLSLGLGLVLGLVSPSLPIPLNDPAMGLLQYILIFGLTTLWVLGRFQQLGVKLRHVVGHMPLAYHWLPALGLVLTLITFSAGSFLLSFYGLSLVAPQFVEKVLVGLQLSSSQTQFPELYRFLTVLTLVIVAPVAEELIFRGVLLQRWAKTWGIRTALMASSLLFGLCHANVLGLSVFGLIMGILYIQTRTLLVPIACHALNNALVLLFSIATHESTPQSAPSLASLQSSLGAGIILVTLSAPWLVWFVTRNFPQANTPTPYAVNSGTTHSSTHSPSHS